MPLTGPSAKRVKLSPCLRRLFFCKRSKTWFSDPQPLWLKKINNSDPRPDCNIRSFFLPNCRLFYSVYCLFSITDFLFLVVVCQTKRSMDEQTCRDFLEKYFAGNFELLSFIKRDTCSCDINFNCYINNAEGVNRFLYERNKRNEVVFVL